MTLRRSCMAIGLASCLTAGLLGTGCSSSPSSNGPANSGLGGSGGVSTGGTTGSGGSSASALGGTSKGGSSSNSGGLSPSGGASQSGTSNSSGGVFAGSGGTVGQGGGASGGVSTTTGGRTASTGATLGNGGAAGTRTGGASAVGGITGATGGAGGASGGITGNSGGTAGSTGTTTSTGGTSTGGAATGGATGSYMLPPPDQCHDRDYIPGDSYLKTGCLSGDTTSECGGKCETASVCESPTAKPTADRLYMCQRNLLFSPEMEQAVIDDGLQGFHYAVVGHDPDTAGIDGNAHPCCQCYQLVYAYPSPSNDKQVLVDPDHPTTNPTSAIPVPAPLIVQAFNTAASPTTFDVYMPAGGMGAQNGCFLLPNSGADAAQRKYMYTNYPLDGQPGNGGVKPASLDEWAADCKTKSPDLHPMWVTQATITSPACIKDFTDACNKITSTIPGLSEQGRTGCVKANTIDTFYHLNWSVYAMKVQCPEHLTRVTGCKLATQAGVKAVKPDVKTAAQASKDSDFWSKTGNTNNLYETTTMEDCCRPTCASYSQISGFGLTTDPQYRSFYNCDINGVPYTQKQ